MRARGAAVAFAAVLLAVLLAPAVLTQPARAGTDFYLVLGDVGCTRTTIATDSGCWAPNSGGGGGAGIPGATDTAHLDANSGAFTGDIDVLLDVYDWNATGFPGTITSTTGVLRVEHDFLNGGTFHFTTSSTMYVGGNFTATSGTFDGSSSCVGIPSPTSNAHVVLFGVGNFSIDAPPSHAGFCSLSSNGGGANVTVRSDLKAAFLSPGALPDHWAFGYHNLTVDTFTPQVNNTLFGTALGDMEFFYTASGTNGGYLTVSNFTQYTPQGAAHLVAWQMRSITNPTTGSLQFTFRDLRPGNFYYLCAVTTTVPIQSFTMTLATQADVLGEIVWQITAGSPQWPTWSGTWNMYATDTACPQPTPPSVTSGAYANISVGPSLVISAATVSASQVTTSSATLRGTSTLQLTYSADVNGNHITGLAGYPSVMPGLAWESVEGGAATDASYLTYANGTRLNVSVNSTIYYNAHIAYLPPCSTIWYYAFVIGLTPFSEGQSPLKSFSTPCNVQPSGQTYFEWGPTFLLGNRTANVSTAGGSFSAALYSLSSNATYYFRACVDTGVSVLGAASPQCGDILTFKTNAVTSVGSGNIDLAPVLNAFWILLFIAACTLIVVAAWMVRDKL